jgi:hypothetical protein
VAAQVEVELPGSAGAMIVAASPGSATVVAEVEPPGSGVHEPENIAAVDIWAERAQPVTAAPFDQDYPGHIASSYRVVVPMALAVARAVVVLRLPLSHSIYWTSNMHKTR